MRHAIALSAQAIGDPGLRPFGAIVVRNGTVVGEGVNRSIELSDPTSHGEVEAIRAACSALGTLDLSDCILYTSCEPCPMCRATTMMAGITRIIYGASIEDAGNIYKAHPEAPRAMPISADEMRARVGATIEHSGLSPSKALSSEAIKILNDFAADRTARLKLKNG